MGHVLWDMSSVAPRVGLCHVSGMPTETSTTDKHTRPTNAGDHTLPSQRPTETPATEAVESATTTEAKTRDTPPHKDLRGKPVTLEEVERELGPLPSELREQVMERRRVTQAAQTPPPGPPPRAESLRDDKARARELRAAQAAQAAQTQPTPAPQSMVNAAAGAAASRDPNRGGKRR